MVCMLLISWVFPSLSGHCGDVTDQVEYLGIPAAERYTERAEFYARNIWDLQAYDDRLYIGTGNWDNQGPAPNAGPVPILAWDPVKNSTVKEGHVDDEEISSFKVIDGTLYIPGSDAMESWDWGNLYRRQTNGSWQKLRTIPKAIHAFALTGFHGKLYAGLKATGSVPWYVNIKGYGGAVAVSGDQGASWQFLPLGGFGVFSFLHVAGNLYAVDLTQGPGLQRWIERHNREDYYAPVYALDDTGNGFERRQDLDAGRLFPDTPGVYKKACGISRSVTVDHMALYIGASGGGPFGLYRADSLIKNHVQTRRIPLPEGSVPRDLLVRNGCVFVLLQCPGKTPGVEIGVLANRDLEQWTELLHFSAPTFARSFEIFKGDVYFGLGGTVKNRKDWVQTDIHPETGQLLRVKARAVPRLDELLTK